MNIENILNEGINILQKNNIPNPQLDSEILLSNSIKRDKKHIILNPKELLNPEQSKIFIYIGSFSRGRGIELSVEAFTKKGISSHVVFLGYGEQKDRLLELSELHGNLHVHDSVADEDVVAVTKSADIGLCLIENVSLSDYLCLPNKLFEYAFSGLPVLASDFPDMSSVINRYNLGKCSDLDPESIYESIKEFEGESELLKIDSSELFDLSWEAQGDKLEKMYREFLA